MTIRSVEDVLRLLDGMVPPGTAGVADESVDKPDENLAAWISQGVVEPGRALDLGCGPGRNARYLASLGFEVDAVDASPVVIERARERAGDARVWFHCGNVFELTLRGGYDLVYDSGFFHHLAPHRRPSYLELLQRALMPGGHFGLVCFGSGGAALSDADVYRVGDLGAGLAYTEDSLREIFGGLAEVEQRGMVEQADDSPLFGKAVLWTALFRFPGYRKAAEARARVLRGLMTVADRRRELIDALWETTGPASAEEAVQRVLGVDEVQARAVLDLQVRRLTPWQMAMIRKELDQGAD
ncbi:hypothetical protein GCM10027445_13460 [Amycolatopsis endophytica]|uniref:SAM-dependent methyltransferase n=1 Tax=Amycolatopsis endophytica TaxID=860233 RepID=A0A853B3R8_9PSEU|nr:methyltransferase domain-containing protein [Amycolatopsis endophytica]NYI89482.1 SAM-dependent methyltransferase [Amycolatopsis endophytica]